MPCVKMYNGSPTIFIDNEPKFGAMIMSDKLMKGWNGEPDPHFAAFYNAGFHFFQVSIEYGKPSFDSAYDEVTDSFSKDAFICFEELKEYALRYPDVRFLLRVGIESRDPKSPWAKKHPGQFEKLEDGKIDMTPTTSYASEVGLADAKRYLKAIIDTTIEMGLSRNILGILICSGFSAEWCKFASQADYASDYSEPMQRYFKEWLKDKYHNDEALQIAWGNPLITLDTVRVPSAKEQREVTHGVFRDPIKQCIAIDYFTALADLSSRNICELCKAVKEYSEDEYLAGAFYGYLIDNFSNHGFYIAGLDVDHTWGARSGHSGLEKVLASPYLDFLSSPYRYDFRGMGGEGGFRSPYESVRSAGKLWLSEEDIRTHLSGDDVGYGQAQNAEETVQLIRRQCANVLSHSAAAWFCDWWIGEAGAFDDPIVMAELKRFAALGKEALEDKERGSVAEIAVVVDAMSPLIRSMKNDLDVANFYSIAWEFPRIGAPADFILLSDIIEGKAKHYKVYYILDTYMLTETDRDKLKKAMEWGGSVIIWTYAAGISDGKTVDVKNIALTTGINVKKRRDRWCMRSYITNYQHPITNKLSQTLHWGTDRMIEPLLAGDDEEAVKLGNVVINEGRCEAGLLLKEYDDFKVIWSAAQGLPASLLREIARFSGVHIYNDEGDVMYASGEFLMLHSLKGGKRCVKLPSAMTVCDVVLEKEIASDVMEFEADFGKETTILYRLKKSE